MNDLATPCFVDTNILVYSLTHDDKRWSRSEELISGLMELNALRTSTQVLQEFLAVTTRKLTPNLSPQQAMVHIERFAVCPVAINDMHTLRAAAQLTARESISFWDALMVAAAAQARCTRIYTEDLQHGRTLLGVRIVNPFLD